MVRTQIQLPDQIYRQAKRIAAEREMTLAEVVRRGVEYMIRIHPPARVERGEWRLPEPLRLGEFLSPSSTWREAANEPSTPPPSRR